MFPSVYILKWTLLCLLLFVTCVVAEDYYNLLGISKDADNREIRRAYKKLALLYHPDKNKNNEEIQEKFVKISKAYEVLKDTETRRKYDQYGEAGLDDSHNQHHHYQSWSYFENFGIYDDDPEIITLSDSEFSQSVQGRSYVWFINFYSPMCSHCHHLAPAWRKLAQELLGVVRIGAVNCGEEWSLCRQQGIHSYPTLKLYPKETEYRGSRTTETLVNFVFDSISSKYIKLTKKNLDHYLKDPNVSKLSWLIFVCNQASDCPSETTQLKLSVMLTGMVNVAVVNYDPEFAEFIAETPGVLYYEPGKVKKDFATNILSNDAQEIFRTILLMLPQIEEVTADSMADLSTSMESQRNVAQLLCFFSDKETVDLSLNELPFLLSIIKVSRVNCDRSIGICNELHIHKFPAFVVLKPRGKYEVYHGRVSPRDIAAFVEDSLSSTVESLGPNDFPSRVINSGEPWFVDFYAPWCPPCLRLLPEWRRASQEIGDMVHFGTVDCTIHHALCSQYKIHSYPTTVLYNQTVPHKYDGQRNFMDIVEFVKDTLSPSVVSLTSTSFEKLVERRPANEMWAVDFFAPWCGPCQQLSVQWRKLAKLVSGVFNIHVASIDCTVHSELCDSQGIRSYPTIRLYPTGGQQYITYGSYNRDVHSLRAWVYRFLPSRVIELDNNDFYNKVVYSRERWIIDFYAPWCGHCEMFAPEFESVAQDLGDQVKAAKVNCDILQYVCNEAGIRAYPSVRFYPGSRNSQPQSVHGIDVHSQDQETIITFVKNWLRTSKVSDNLEENEVLRERDEL